MPHSKSIIMSIKKIHLADLDPYISDTLSASFRAPEVKGFMLCMTHGGHKQVHYMEHLSPE